VRTFEVVVRRLLADGTHQFVKVLVENVRSRGAALRSVAARLARGCEVTGEAEEVR